jgi:hypothetical protein
MADFEDRQDTENDKEWEEQDRFTSLMFGPRRENRGNISQHSEELRTNHPSIDYEELMTNIDTLLDSFHGLKPLFSKVYPHIQQLWKKK